jgi:hypothetical protein
VYTIRKDQDQYILEKSGKPLLTPRGESVRTTHQILADRLLADLRKHGEDPSDPVSLVAFHYPMIDFFNDAPRVGLEHSVAIGLDQENDWTFNCPTAAPEPMMKWMSFFGTHSTRSEQGKKWLSTLSLMQLCAVCVVGRATESVNIPFTAAMTQFSEKEIVAYAKIVNEYYPYLSTQDLTQILKNFLFYFNLDKSANG